MSQHESPPPSSASPQKADATDEKRLARRERSKQLQSDFLRQIREIQSSVKSSDDADNSPSVAELHNAWQDGVGEVVREALSDFQGASSERCDEDLTTAAHEQIAATLLELRQLSERQQQHLDEARQENAERYSEQIRQMERLLAAIEQDREADRNRLQALEESRDQRDSVAAESAIVAQLEELRSDNERLQEKLAQEQLRQPAEEHGTADADLQRRFEMAVQDLRESRQEVQKLEQQLQEAQRSNAATGNAPSHSSSSDSSVGMDWEAQKRKMLAELEGDDETTIPADERLSIEGTIRITDDVVTKKEARIRELEEQLGSLSDSEHDRGVAAEQTLLDEDEVIGRERERLRQMQVEWEEKLRKAEIEISVERAKMARERRELEEKMTVLQQELKDETGQAAGEQEGGKTNRRWLARLGLTDQE